MNMYMEADECACVCACAHAQLHISRNGTILAVERDLGIGKYGGKYDKVK